MDHIVANIDKAGPMHIILSLQADEVTFDRPFSWSKEMIIDLQQFTIKRNFVKIKICTCIFLFVKILIYL